jgi:hypothetical protein
VDLLSAAKDPRINSLNQAQREQLSKALTSLYRKEAKDTASLLLLKAPRAGFGKTRLLGDAVTDSGEHLVPLALKFHPESELTWPSVSRELLEELKHSSTEQEDWSKLRELTAGIFVSFVVKLIEEGKLPCANKEQAVQILSARPAELFQEGTAANLIGEWLKRHFNALRKPLVEAAERVPRVSDAEPWMEALFAHASLGSPASASMLVDLVASSRQNVLQFLRLVAQWRPVLLLVDHLDPFYHQPQAGLKISSMLLELSELSGVYTVLSVNEDLWQQTFAKHLPSALEDRLTATQLTLDNVNLDVAQQLVVQRLEASTVPAPWADYFEKFLDLPAYMQAQQGVSARSLLRHAGQRWQEFNALLAQKKNPLAQPAAATAPATVTTTDQISPPTITVPAVQQNASVTAEHPMTATVTTAKAHVPVMPNPQMVPPLSYQQPQVASVFPAQKQEPSSELPALAEPTIIEGPKQDFLHIQPQPTVVPEPQPMPQQVAPSTGQPPSRPMQGPFAVPQQQPSAPMRPAYPSRPFSDRAEPQTPFAMVFHPEAMPTQQLPTVPLVVPPAPAQPAAPVATDIVSPFSPAPTSAQSSVAPDAVERLREMMEKLKQKTGPLSANNTATPRPQPPVQPAPIVEAQVKSPVNTNLVALPMIASNSPEGLLAGRFEALRLQTASEAQHRPLDRQKLRELIRLAGRRFPLVKYDEVPLVTQPGQSVPRWTLQGLEVFFGLGDFMDRAYWKATGEVIAARSRALEQSGPNASAQVKLIALKSDRDTLAWSTLLNSNALPAEVRPRTEGLHLDARSISSLYAMQRIIIEAESGAIETTPVQVMSVLARELDFFWKRVTRPL